MTSDEMGGILLDGSCPPVYDRVGSPTFLPTSYRSDFRLVGSRFARQAVTARVRSCRSADISTVSETHLRYFFKSLPNWLPVCRVAFARRVVTARVWSCRSAEISTPSETHLPYISESLANWLPLCRVAFCWTGRDGPYPIESVRRHFYLLWNPAATFFLDSRKLTFGLSGGVLLDGSWRPVSDRVGPPAFLPSLKPTYHIFRSLWRAYFRFVGRGLWRPVSDCVGPPTFLPETHLPHISQSLANWLPVCRMAFC